MKCLVPNYSCPENPCLGGYRPQIPVLAVLCSQLNLLNPPTPQTKFLGMPLLAKETEGMCQLSEQYATDTLHYQLSKIKNS